MGVNAGLFNMLKQDPGSRDCYAAVTASLLNYYAKFTMGSDFVQVTIEEMVRFAKSRKIENKEKELLEAIGLLAEGPFDSDNGFWNNRKTRESICWNQISEQLSKNCVVICTTGKKIEHSVALVSAPRSNRIGYKNPAVGYELIESNWIFTKSSAYQPEPNYLLLERGSFVSKVMFTTSSFNKVIRAISILRE